MSLLARLVGDGYQRGAFARWASGLPEQPAGPASPQAMTDGSISMQEWADWFSSQRRGAEVTTPRAAMSIGAVYASVALIAGAIASMPLKFYVRRENGEREEYTPDAWWLFNEAWMPCWAAATAWEFTTQSLLLRGDWFARIHRQSPLSPRIIGIEPWHPDRVDVERRDERLRYTLYPQDGIQPAGAKPLVLDQDDVLHVAGPGFDGRRGMSQIATVLRNTGAISLAADEHSAAFFRNSARPDYALSTDKGLDREQIEHLRTQVAENHRGASNAYRPMVLINGLKVDPITMNAEDAQLIETRGFQVEDIARIFGVPPFMIGHAEKTTSWGSGVEQMGLGFVKYTLQRHLVKIEQEINRKVFRTARNFCEFLTAGLERGDIKSRNEAYRIAVGRAGEPGWLTVNEIRRAENLPPVEGGDALATASIAPTGPTEAEEAAEASRAATRAEIVAMREQVVGALAAQKPPIVNVEAPIVNVAAPAAPDVLVEAPIVNVAAPAAPDVYVEAPVVNVAAPAIPAAQVVLNSPRTVVEEFERDDKLEITRIVRRVED